MLVTGKAIPIPEKMETEKEQPTQKEDQNGTRKNFNRRNGTGKFAFFRGINYFKRKRSEILEFIKSIEYKTLNEESSQKVKELTDKLRHLMIPRFPLNPVHFQIFKLRRSKVFFRRMPYFKIVKIAEKILIRKSDFKRERIWEKYANMRVKFEEESRKFAKSRNEIEYQILKIQGKPLMRRKFRAFNYFKKEYIEKIKVDPEKGKIPNAEIKEKWKSLEPDKKKEYYLQSKKDKENMINQRKEQKSLSKKPLKENVTSEKEKLIKEEAIQPGPLTEKN